LSGARAGRRGPRFVAFATAAWALSSGCAVFTDLSSEPYHLADAGATEGGACAGDGGCSGAEIQCFSTGDCPTAGNVCCLTATSPNAPGTACVAPSACQGSLSFQLCKSTTECPTRDSCTSQTCTLNGTSFALKACTQIPFVCTPQ
jgi:hypothetical protein